LKFGLVAAVVKIDSKPMEDFDKNLLDRLINLKENGSSSLEIMNLGYRGANNDYIANLKKVRRNKEKLFINID
jgi:hypothetical protein